MVKKNIYIKDLMLILNSIIIIMTYNKNNKVKNVFYNRKTCWSLNYLSDKYCIAKFQYLIEYKFIYYKTKNFIIEINLT